MNMTPSDIAREQSDAIARDMDIYVSGSALTDKYQAAREYFHGPYAQFFILTAAAKIVQESGAGEALEGCKTRETRDGWLDSQWHDQEDCDAALAKLRALTEHSGNPQP